MISTSGDKPVDMLTDKLGKAEGFDALNKVAVMDKDDSNYAGLDLDEAKRVLDA